MTERRDVMRNEMATPMIPKRGTKIKLQMVLHTAMIIEIRSLSFTFPSPMIYVPIKLPSVDRLYPTASIERATADVLDHLLPNRMAIMGFGNRIIKTAK